jgi:hypothetical protein
MTIKKLAKTFAGAAVLSVFGAAVIYQVKKRTKGFLGD